MRIILWITPLFLLLAAFSLKAEENLKQAEAFLEEAILYVNDQEIEKGLKAFLKSIERSPKKKMKTRFTEHYEHALQIFLKQQDDISQSQEKTLQEIYPNSYQTPKNDPGLGFVLAANHALVGDYSKFMRAFFDCYQKQSNHYMVYRVLGMVHLKLMKFGKTPQEKEVQKNFAFNYFKEALQLNPRDTILFRFTLLLVDPSERTNLLKENLNIILEEDTMLARVDLIQYVQEALVCGHGDLVQKLVNKAKLKYPSSRALDRADQYIENYQNQNMKEKGVI
ncbi:MAG: hypothetical protein S4CHLAM7_04380 [Chlamydiae bacterium]|nr:hypothetical protein [Chlamydiota bacterium]